MNDIHFSLIKVSGYRGRNFTLKMNPRGQHTIFVMDGNTGKTTTIELIRWCFRYKENEAKNNFQHMWTRPAHVLDDTKKGQQVCEITIQFSAVDDTDDEHFFQFKRVTEGEFDTSVEPVGDKITKISDTLEIDHGREVKNGDEAHDYLSHEFRFHECAEYFCFDGEKAREVMQLAADSAKIDLLLNIINRRITHPKIEEYKEKLNNLRERIFADAKSRITDKALQMGMSRLSSKNLELLMFRKDLEIVREDKDTHSLAKKKLEDALILVEDQITSAKADSLIERIKYENEQRTVFNEIAKNRSLIYEDSLKWISKDATAAINELKTLVKEKGNLPEPYRRDLIDSCIKSGICEICGRTLDEASKQRIKELGRQVAPHDVQIFLSSSFSIPELIYDPKNQNDLVRKLIDRYQELDINIKSAGLSKENEELVSQRDSMRSQIALLTSQIADLVKDEETLNEGIRDLKKEITELEEKNFTLRENKIILDKIDASLQIVDEAAEKIKARAIDIISDVISDGVSSILGSRFSAKLSGTNGLMLGEDGFYGKEKGGYSGRLILSYCFAEAMTLVDPIIVDTPVGNVGSQRDALAAHLIANHKQVVLLCLPTELPNFADGISEKPMEIKNIEVR